MVWWFKITGCLSSNSDSTTFGDFCVRLSDVIHHSRLIIETIVGGGDTCTVPHREPGNGRIEYTFIVSAVT